MAHTGVTVLLLFFGLFTSTVFGNGCELLSVAGNSSSDFNLTVTPDTLYDKTNYTVGLEGSGNVSVIFQALSTSPFAGNWSAGNVDCDASPLFLNPFETQTRLEAQWISSANVISVNITAHITTANGTFIVSKTLSQVATTQTTIGPNTASSTVSTGPNTASSTVSTGPNTASSTVSTGPNTGNSTANSTSASTVTTATTPLKTTNATSAVKTSYLTLAFLLLMLSITSNYLL